MMQTQMFIPVEIACKYEINLKSNLHLLRIGYLRKSTNPVYIYSICEYLGLPSPPPMFVLSSMRSDCDVIEYTCLQGQQWCVCWWLNPIQSLVKSVRHYNIYSRFALCGKIMFAFCKNLRKRVANLYVCVTVFQRLPKLHPKPFACV